MSHPPLAATESSRLGFKPGFTLRCAAIAAALPLSLLCAGKAEAITAIQTQNGTNNTTVFNNLATGTGASRPLVPTAVQSNSFSKFDPNLGTLTGIRFEGTGEVSGSLRGTRQSAPVGSRAKLDASEGTFTTNFGSGTWILPGVNQTIFNANPSDLPTGTPSATFGQLNTAITNNFNVNSFTNDAAILAAFTGTGNVSATFNWTIALDITNGATNGTTWFLGTSTNPAAARVSALFQDITLTYEYRPNTPGPLPILGASAAFVCSRRIRRRILMSRTTA
ncbi:choice-of-anchor E domain-containing protein [Cyanobium sp. FGCU-52]|nr:choice-of-anchor E domain-containing protein [Cyanobium sp. FGCU52]